MRSRLGRRCVVVVVAVGALVFAAGASAAAPRYIMVTGPGLQQPVLLDDWSENLRFMQAVSSGARIGAPRLARRPKFRVSLFWNEGFWTERPLRAEDADQRGWFYPAYGKRRAAWEMEPASYAPPSQRLATWALLSLLSAHGIPRRCAVKASTRVCSRTA